MTVLRFGVSFFLAAYGMAVGLGVVENVDAKRLLLGLSLVMFLSCVSEAMRPQSRHLDESGRFFV